LDEFDVKIEGRIDQILAEILGISRNQTANLIKSENVFLNSQICSKPSLKAQIGDKIRVFYPAAPKAEFGEVKFDVEIIYEDDDILVINKPSNLVVHPASSVKEPTLVDWLKAKNFTLSTINGEIRAGIVHRLDKGTSGAMVVAKNNAAHANLSAQLTDKSMGRIYLALTDLPLKENCIIERPIGRNPNNRLKKAIITNGRAAKSAFMNIHSGKFNLVAAKLFTGRTHQIRVHLASINRHILGDNLYGIKSDLGRIMLHAYLLYFSHPKTGEMMKFRANLSDEFTKFFSENLEETYEKIEQNRLFSAFGDADKWMRIQ